MTTRSAGAKDTRSSISSMISSFSYEWSSLLERTVPFVWAACLMHKTASISYSVCDGVQRSLRMWYAILKNLSTSYLAITLGCFIIPWMNLCETSSHRSTDSGHEDGRQQEASSSANAPEGRLAFQRASRAFDHPYTCANLSTLPKCGSPPN